MKTLAVIPARGGSKRIPRKNIREFLGKPIIAYSIEAARQCGFVDEVMVSTDDKEISAIARSLGATVPFLRSAVAANDFAGLAEVLVEVLEGYARLGKSFDRVLCLLATAPLLRQDSLVKADALLNTHPLDAVLSVARFKYPIFRALKADGARVAMFWPENYQKRSQDLPVAYHDAGQFYLINTPTLLAEKILLPKRTGHIELDELEVQDIDDEGDWSLAELKYARVRGETGLERN